MKYNMNYGVIEAKNRCDGVLRIYELLMILL